MLSLPIMTISLHLHGLTKETLFKKGDFNALSSLYNEMLSRNIVKDCAPLVGEGYLAFLLYKSSKDPSFLYKISITRDEKHNSFLYEATPSGGKQIAQARKLAPVIKKFKYYLGATHHIQEWKKPKRATEREKI